jgi:transketolase
MRVVVPADADDVRQVVRVAANDKEPIYIRLEREEPIRQPEHKFKLGRAVVIREGRDVTLVACGSMVGFAALAADILARKGIGAGVINMHTIKPIDAEAILRAGKATGAIVTLEEGQITGGLGSGVAEVIAEKASSPIRLHRIGFEDTLVDIIGTYKDILERYELMPTDIAKKVERFVRSARR